MESKRFTVYSHPLSAFSQRVRLALHLKGIDFDVVDIDIFSGEQHNPAYMRINPAGTVPSMKDGFRIITDSDDIIKYIDLFQNISGSPALIPNPSTREGQEIAKWRGVLNGIAMFTVTYGLFLNPELSVTGVTMMPPMKREDLDKVFCQAIEALDSLAKENKDLENAYLTKRDRTKTQLEDKTTLSLENVSAELDKMEAVLDAVEQQLKRSSEPHQLFSGQTSTDCFMFGKTMNIIDIYMAILLERLTVLGLISRYIGKTKRRLLYEYYFRLSRVPAVAKTDILKIPQSVRIELAK